MQLLTTILKSSPITLFQIFFKPDELKMIKLNPWFSLYCHLVRLQRQSVCHYSLLLVKFRAHFVDNETLLNCKMF